MKQLYTAVSLAIPTDVILAPVVVPMKDWSSFFKLIASTVTMVFL